MEPRLHILLHMRVSENAAEFLGLNTVGPRMHVMLHMRLTLHGRMLKM
jgi:hypothetical protein